MTLYSYNCGHMFVLWTHLYYTHTLGLSKPIECPVPRVNPNVSCGLWMMVMCQCRSICGNKLATRLGDVGNGQGYA